MRKIIYLIALFGFTSLSCTGSQESSTPEHLEHATMGVLDGKSDADLLFYALDGGYRNARSIDYVSSEDHLYIVEQGRNRFLRLTSDGLRIDSVGSRGVSDYRFDSPEYIDATNGFQIFIADKNNSRVQLFGRRLAYLSSIIPPSERQGINPVFFSPTAVTANTFGDVFIYDSESHHILKYDRNGRFQLSFPLSLFEVDLPLRALVSLEDRLYITEHDSGLMHILTTQGGYKGFAAGSEGLRGIYVRNERIWGVTADRILVFNTNGRLLHSFSHNINEPVQGIAVSSSRIFVLTSSSLSAVQTPLL